MENYGIQIDAVNKTIKVVTFYDKFNGMKKKLGVRMAEAVDLGGGIVTMWLDEEGRFVDGQQWFKLSNGQLFAGSAMVVFGDYFKPDVRDLDRLKSMVTFVESETLTETETEPDCGFIGSLAEADAAIAAGKLPAHMRAFFT